ncbi:ATP-binding protein [Sporomusa carbonis]|uniref:ATP-binding protein n=1 Tax=Sporomusa carbonis TaxID=3076075 RepID=UPI003C7D15B8
MFIPFTQLMIHSLIATAMLDRLLHHAHVINIRGDTYRLKDRLKVGFMPTTPANINPA